MYGGVSCNCRRRGNTYETFAPLGTEDECWRAYHNPDNHRVGGLRAG